MIYVLPSFFHAIRDEIAAAWRKMASPHATVEYVINVLYRMPGFKSNFFTLALKRLVVIKPFSLSNA